MPKLLDIDSFCRDLPEIRAIKITDNKGRFTNNGLFSMTVFGPIDSYVCGCGKYSGVRWSGKVCEICGVELTTSNERRRRFAKIRLPFEVVNPIFYDLVTTTFNKKFKKQLDSLMNDEESVLAVREESGECLVSKEDSLTLDNSVTVYHKSEAIIRFIECTCKIESAKRGDAIFAHKVQVILDNMDKLLIRDIIVLPCDLRPASKNVKNNSHFVDKINRFYTQILTRKDVIENTILDVSNDKKIYYYYYRQIQKDVFELYDHIITSLSKKEGLIRQYILGKRIDFSGRAVIIPDPTISIDQCVLPYLMFLELYKVKLAKRLVEDGEFKIINEAIDYIDDCIVKEDHSLINICQYIAKDEVCLLNRQPSLNRLNILGFKVLVSLSYVIRIHPLVCSCFNADFDGDQMAVYVPISSSSKREIMEKFLITKNFFNPANNTLTTIPSQDIILGIYLLTSLKFKNLDCKTKTDSSNKLIEKHFKIFNDCLPDDYPFIREVVDGKKLMNILNDIMDRYDEDTMKVVLDRIKVVGFKYATLYGQTISLDQIDVNRCRQLRDAIFDNKNNIFKKQLNSLNDEDTKDKLRDSFKSSYIIDSGSRANWDQMKQVMLARGFVSNFKGVIDKRAIRSSLIDGLTPFEFFLSTYGSRKGLLDVALKTGVSGYLSRKLIFSCVNLQKSKDVDDCGSNDYFKVNIVDKKKALMLLYRFYLDNKTNDLVEITKDNMDTLVGQTILMRSPIYCLNEEICHKCYGNLYKKFHSRFIGIIAAQSLGERTTQLVLRTFHTSGVAKSSSSDDENSNEKLRQEDIVADLTSVSKIFHKFDLGGCEEIVDRLYTIFNETSDIHYIHFESIISQLMWKGYKKWRLLSNRGEVKNEYYSIQKVPGYESWILGLGFSNPRQHILRGLCEEGNYSGILDRILTGQKI